MKYLLFIVLLVAVVMTAGCVGENKNSVVTTTQTTSAPDRIILLNGTIGECLSEPNNDVFQLCIDKDVKVSLKKNNISASGTLFYKKIGIGIEKDEVSATVNLKIYNNKNVKVAEVSKTLAVDKNGQTLFDLNTEISENNPSGWTYRINVEKNKDESVPIQSTPMQTISLQSTPKQTIPILRQQTGPVCTAKYYSYRYGSQWTISGTVTNDGASGKCEVDASLLGTNGVELEQSSRILSLLSGESQSFEMEFVDTTNRGVSIKVSISQKY